jgi:hypothetical protein
MEMQWKIVNGLRMAQDGVARWMHALVYMQPNGCYISTWSKHTPFQCKSRDQGVHLFILRGLGNKITVL